MKKFMLKILLIISIVPWLFLLVAMLYYFFYGHGGYDISGIEIPIKYGFEAMGQYLYLTFSFKCFGIVWVPVYTICLIYQIIYFKKLKYII